jgi:hypothetical protein
MHLTQQVVVTLPVEKIDWLCIAPLRPHVPGHVSAACCHAHCRLAERVEEEIGDMYMGHAVAQRARAGLRDLVQVARCA